MREKQDKLSEAISYLEKVIDGAKSFNAKKKWINELKNWQK